MNKIAVFQGHLSNHYLYLNMRKLIKTLLPIKIIDRYSLIKQELNNSLFGVQTPDIYYPSHHKLEAVFIHIPKAAGNSVTKVIYNLPSIEVGGHRRALSYKLNSQKLFHKYFIFTFVRNPFDRLYSAFNFLKQGGMNEDDRDFAEKYLVQKKTFENFVLDLRDTKYRADIRKYVHFIDQHKFICDDHNHILIDYIARYENFDAEMIYICRKIGVDHIALKENITSGNIPSYVSQYTPEMVEIVAKIYKTDFDILNYSKSLDRSH